MPGLEIETGLEDAVYVIRVRGELDLAGRPELDRALEEAESSHAGPILVDLEELSFIDAAGLASLALAARRSEIDGGRLRMTHGQDSVARMFRLTALDTTLPLVGARGA